MSNLKNDFLFSKQMIQTNIIIVGVRFRYLHSTLSLAVGRRAISATRLNLANYVKTVYNAKYISIYHIQ